MSVALLSSQSTDQQALCALRALLTCIIPRKRRILLPLMFGTIGIELLQIESTKLVESFHAQQASGDNKTNVVD